jgi:hypothetical protein
LLEKGLEKFPGDQALTKELELNSFAEKAREEVEQLKKERKFEKAI